MAAGTGAVIVWPELSGLAWFVVAGVCVAVLPLTYFSEIKDWWTARRGGGNAGQAGVFGTDEEAFRLNPGMGRISARLIGVQPDLEASGRVFELFRAAPNKMDEAAPYAALAHRLIEAGSTHDAELLLLDIPDEVSEVDRESALSEFFFSDPADSRPKDSFA